MVISDVHVGKKTEITQVSSWYRIGGRWRERIATHTPEQHLYYTILRDAVQVLVDASDGKHRTAADRVRVNIQLGPTWDWVRGGEGVVTFHLCCEVTGFDEETIRRVLREQLGGRVVDNGVAEPGCEA